MLYRRSTVRIPFQPLPSLALALLLDRGTIIRDIRCPNAAKDNLTTDNTNPRQKGRITHPLTITPDKPLDIIIFIPITLAYASKEQDMSTQLTQGMYLTIIQFGHIENFTHNDTG